MEKNGLTRKYELVVIIDAKLPGDAKESVRKDVAGLIDKHGGKVINSQVWLEKHRMTFEIKKCGEGTYFLFNFEGKSSIIAKIKPLLKLDERILRFEFIVLEAKKTAETARA